MAFPCGGLRPRALYPRFLVHFPLSSFSLDFACPVLEGLYKCSEGGPVLGSYGSESLLGPPDFVELEAEQPAQHSHFAHL